MKATARILFQSLPGACVALLAFTAHPARAATATPQRPREASPSQSSPKPQDSLAQIVEPIGRSALQAGAESLVVALDIGGRRAFSCGFGAVSGHAPDGETPFHAGPLLPTFLAVAAQALAEEGRLNLDAPLSEVLPELPYDGVRVDQLLTHTSGIPSYGELLRAGRPRTSEVEPQRILAWLRSGPLDSTPGTCARYSSTNDLLLGLVLEKVTGKSVRSILEERVFARAGMENTAFGCAPGARAASRVEQEFAGAFEDQEGTPPPFQAQELCSTAQDLVRFQRALVEHRLLPHGALELRAAPARLANGAPSACGRGISLTGLGEYACHSAGGVLAGQGVQLAYYPAFEATVVVWMSDEEAPVQPLAARIARALFDLDQPEIHDLPTSPELRASHVGDYYAGCTSHTITDEGGHLVLYPPGDQRTVLLYQGGESFVAQDDSDVRLEFENEDGKIVAFILYEHGISMRARRLY